MICTYILCAYICIHTYKHRDLQTYKHTDMQTCIHMYIAYAYTDRHTHTFIHLLHARIRSYRYKILICMLCIHTESLRSASETLIHLLSSFDRSF